MLHGLKAFICMECIIPIFFSSLSHSGNVCELYTLFKCNRISFFTSIDSFRYSARKTIGTGSPKNVHFFTEISE